MKRVALFGARGYLGTQLHAYLRDSGWVVDGFDMPTCDVTDKIFWKTFDPKLYDSVLFFAGRTGTEVSFIDAESFVNVNEVGLLNLLQKLAPLGISAPYILFPSTRLVYRGSDFALKEDSPKEPRTVYAANKLACEALLQAYAFRYSIPYSVVRICVPFGNLVSHDYSYGTIGFFLKQAETGRIALYGDGKLRRTFTHVGNICEVVQRLISERICGIYNVGGIHMSLSEAASLVARRKGAVVDFVPWPEPAQRVESGSTYFDFFHLQSAIGEIQYMPISSLFG